MLHSKTPSRVRSCENPRGKVSDGMSREKRSELTITRPVKLLAAALAVTVTPQAKMLKLNHLATGRRWMR